VFLSQTAKTVHVLYRRADIRDTMSEYLVKRLEDAPNIIPHPESEISALHGLDSAEDDADRLVAVTQRNRKTGDEQRCDIPFVFLFVGATPFTDWLPKEMSCDKTGFVKTGAQLSNLDLVKAGWSLERMPSEYETSWPRVYAVGDVQAGSVKRVASAGGHDPIAAALCLFFLTNTPAGLGGLYLFQAIAAQNGRVVWDHICPKCHHLAL